MQQIKGFHRSTLMYSTDVPLHLNIGQRHAIWTGDPQGWLTAFRERAS
jgi:hypothetical protein